MFTQEQLGAISGVVVEALKPLSEQVREGFKSHQEQIAKVSVQITALEQKNEKSSLETSESIKDLQEDLGPLYKIIKDIKWDVGITKSKLAIAEENRPALFMRSPKNS